MPIVRTRAKEEPLLDIEEESSHDKIESPKVCVPATYKSMKENEKKIHNIQIDIIFSVMILLVMYSIRHNVTLCMFIAVTRLLFIVTGIYLKGNARFYVVSALMIVFGILVLLYDVVNVLAEFSETLDAEFRIHDKGKNAMMEVISMAPVAFQASIVCLNVNEYVILKKK